MTRCGKNGAGKCKRKGKSKSTETSLSMHGEWHTVHASLLELRHTHCQDTATAPFDTASLDAGLRSIERTVHQEVTLLTPPAARRTSATSSAWVDPRINGVYAKCAWDPGFD